jgi:thermitase
MKSISGVSFLLVATVLVISVSHSQLTPIINPRMHSECSFYYDKNGILYGDGIQVKFNVRMFNALTNNQFADVKDLNSEFSHTKDLLLSLNNSFGPLTIIKMVPRAMWGDTVGVNHISGKAVRIRDLSQLYMIRFASPVPVDSVAMEFQRLGEVQAASQPVSVFLDDQPNDPSFGSQWNLTPVNSTEAWDITHGDPSIRIGVVDVGCLTTHPDLTQKIVATDGVVGDHGTWVAGVAGAATNNGIGIASLGWNTSLVALSGLQGTNQFLVSKIDSAVTFYRCDVINMSWLLARFVSLALETQLCPNCSAANAAKWVQFGAEVPSDDAGVDDAVSNAMSQGVICVAAAGNQSDNGNLGPDPADCDPWKVPFICNPAAYSGVIGVSATQMVSGTEQYKPGWNYGSEVSVSAPGVGILTTDPGGGYASKDGTSFASPLVAALASVIKALKPSIPATSFSQTVDTILQSSADKIDVSNHSYVNGRNDYLGYGRINAYKALKYTIEHYSTTIGGAGMTVVLHENFNTASGTTLTILPGTSVQMDPGYYLAINGTINAVGTSSQPITFDRTGTSGSWYGLVLQSGSSGTVSYCNFNNAVVGLTCNASWPTISHNVFRNNYFGIYCNPCGPLIQSNDIQYSTNSGIYLTGATPTIQSNTISNNSSAGITFATTTHLRIYLATLCRGTDMEYIVIPTARLGLHRTPGQGTS